MFDTSTEEGRKEFNQWFRRIEYERGRDFQYDLFDKNKLVGEEKLRDKFNKENSISSMIASSK